MSEHEKPGLIERRPIHKGRIVDLSIDTVRFPNGKTGQLEMIRHSGAAAVLPVLSDPAFIVSSGNDSTGVLWGAVLELIVAFAIVGTGVALFPVLRRQNEGVALGFVTSRLFEAGVITVGILSLLSIVTLQQGAASTAGGR